jgi:hypothetical protein
MKFKTLFMGCIVRVRKPRAPPISHNPRIQNRLQGLSKNRKIDDK